MGRRGARKAGPSARATHEFFGQGLPDVSAPQATTTTHDPQHPPAETPTENPSSSDPLDHPLPQITSPDITLFAPTALSIDAKAEFIFTHVSCVFVLSCSECLLTDQFHSQLYNEGLVRLYYQYKIDKLPVLDGLLTKFSSNYRRRVPDRDTYVWHVDLEIIKQFAEAHVHEESTFFSINGAESTGVKPEDIVITVVDRVGELEVVLCIVEFFLETARKHQVQYGGASRNFTHQPRIDTVYLSTQAARSEQREASESLGLVLRRQKEQDGYQGESHLYQSTEDT